jgi:hypothetical protein
VTSQRSSTARRFPYGSRTKLDGSVLVGWRILATQRFVSLTDLIDTQDGGTIPVFVRRDSGWKLAGAS